MSIQIAGHQIEVGESLNTFIETELKSNEKLLVRIFS